MENPAAHKRAAERVTVCQQHQRESLIRDVYNRSRKLKRVITKVPDGPDAVIILYEPAQPVWQRLATVGHEWSPRPRLRFGSDVDVPVDRDQELRQIRGRGE